MAAFRKSAFFAFFIGGFALSTTFTSANEAAFDSHYKVVNHGVYKAIINCQTRLPAVVVYRTTKDEGNAKRFPRYIEDPALIAKNPDCHAELNHRHRTYQSALTAMGITEQYDVGHLAMSNHLDDNEETIKIANYFTNLAPQAAKKNRSGGAWYATEKIVECHRDIEPLINLVGVIDDPKTTDKNFFVNTFKQTTPDYWWRVIYFTKSDAYFAWIMPNESATSEVKLTSGEFDVTLAELTLRLDITVPELKTLLSRNTKRANYEFIKTETKGQWLTCRGQQTHIS